MPSSPSRALVREVAYLARYGNQPVPVVLDLPARLRRQLAQAISALIEAESGRTEDVDLGEVE